MIATHRAEAAHLFRRVGAPTSEILSAESAHRGCRETASLPTRRALYTQKSGPRQSHSRTYGACDCRGPAFWIGRARGVGPDASKSSIARIHVLTQTPYSRRPEAGGPERERDGDDLERPRL